MTKLELTWIGKENRAKLEPQILQKRHSSKPVFTFRWILA